jgi:hypothetical protein
LCCSASRPSGAAPTDDEAGDQGENDDAEAEGLQQRQGGEEELYLSYPSTFTPWLRPEIQPGLAPGIRCANRECPTY